MSAVRHLYGVQKVRGETAGPDPILRGGDLSIRKGSCYICVEIVIPSKISLEAGKHVHATWQSLLYTRMYFDHGNDNCLFFVIANNIHKIFLFSFILNVYKGRLLRLTCNSSLSNQVNFNHLLSKKKKDFCKIHTFWFFSSWRTCFFKYL